MSSPDSQYILFPGEWNASRRGMAPDGRALKGKRVTSLTLAEVEVSVNANCSLACAHCGFMVPAQPRPYVNDPVAEFEHALATLQALGFTIGSLALLGGEATLAPRKLETMLRIAAESTCVERVELVTNGLTPKGLPMASLSSIDRISLSDYTQGDGLASAWRSWLGEVAPDIEFVVRRHTSWDRWTDPVDLGTDGGQAVYERCWYRRHCITLERGRIFICSRIPKLGLDEQGLELTSATTTEQILAYLHAPRAPEACRTCTPMAGLDPVEPGQQPDGRLPVLQGRALAWFDARTKGER